MVTGNQFSLNQQSKPVPAFASSGSGCDGTGGRLPGLR